MSFPYRDRAASVVPRNSADSATRPETFAPPGRFGVVAVRLDTLYREQAPRLLRLFSRRIGRLEAPDLVQEVFARYGDRIERSTEPVAEPAAYLNGIAGNILRERAKFAARRSADLHQLYDDEQMPGSDPIAALEARDLLRRLDAAVQRLSPRCRQVFLLQRVDGMSRLEIAESTGMSVKAVKKCMEKALFELRREFGPL